MGLRGRSAEKKIHHNLQTKIREDNKRFSRAKAEKKLSGGADPATTTESGGKVIRIFLDHTNYHVRAKAFKLMGSPYPEDAEECAKLCASLKIKNPKVSDGQTTSEAQTTS